MKDIIRENRNQILSNILYVNGNYKGDDEIGYLMQDFHQKGLENMRYEELSEGAKHYEAEGGRDTMCDAVKEYAREYAKEEKADLIKTLMKKCQTHYGTSVGYIRDSG